MSRESLGLGLDMALEHDVKYEIVYLDGGEERTAAGRYRGFRTSDDLLSYEPAH